MAVASASSLTKPPQSDMIFLSHSGQQNYNFVYFLYEALLNANYEKRQFFFDMDNEESLQVGHDYPDRIFQACHNCNVAVVVLSDDYVNSLWPMLELQHILLSLRPDRLIYPLFYQLKPGDLSDPDKLKSWQECWKEHEEEWHIEMWKVQSQMSSSGSELHINLDIESWPDNLSKLQRISGSVRRVLHVDHERTIYESDHEYIRASVSSISVEFPPPAKYSFEAEHIKGQKRMQQEIDEAFQQEDSIGGDGVGAIGVHGIGGSGKSTLCKMMVNFYDSEFPGRCFYLEFPSVDDDVLILKRIKAITRTPKGVTNIDEAMGVLRERLRTKKFFLAIDNIWKHRSKSYEYAKRIMLMDFQPGTKIMLSSRKKNILSSILLQRRPAKENMMMVNAQSHPRIVHVPCLTEAEAVEALKYHYGRWVPEDCLLTLARSCFVGGQCHPLYLKLKGVELEQKGRASFTDQQWKELISRLEVPGGATAEDSDSATNNQSEEANVWRTVQKSLEALPSHLHDIFIDLTATWPAWCFYELGLPTFVRYHYDGCTEQEMYYNVLGQLRRHGLLEVDSDPNYCEGDDEPDKIVIPDLLKHVAEQRRSLPDVHSVAKDAIIGEDLSVITSTDDQLLRKKHISGWNLKASTWKALFGSSARFYSGISMLNPVKPEIRSLFITSAALRWGIFGLHLNLGNNRRAIKALRVLHLQGIEELREIQGWEGVTDLKVLSLSELDGLKRIGSIGCLVRLERLALVRCRGLQMQALVGAGARVSLVKPGDKLPMLQHLTVDFSCRQYLTEVGPRLFDAFPALKVLKLRGCEKLESFPDLDSGMLRTLDLLGCQNLQSIEGISDSSLTALQRLVLKGCRNLKSMSDISKVKSTDLRELDAGWCRSEVGNQLRHMIEGSCGTHHNRLRVLKLAISIASKKYVMNWTDEVGRDEINHEASAGSSSYSAAASSSIPALRLRDAFFSWDLISSDNFVHLQHLDISAKLKAEYPCWLDVSGLPNLKRLDLQDFTSVKKLVISSSLVNLRFLNVENFRALEEINGLGAQHAQVAELWIKRCPSMEKLLDADARLPGLRTLLLNESSKWLAELPSLAAIPPSFEVLSLLQCTSLTDVPWPIRLHLKNNGRDMQALGVVHLQGIKELREIDGWEGVPNLMVLSLCELDGLKRIGSIGCLGRLKRLALVKCGDLELQALVGLKAGVSLVKPGDKLPMLQHLIVDHSCFNHLTEVGPRLFDAFPALEVLKLRGCRKLQNFPVLNSGKLRTLDLFGCENLKSIEGISDSSLTALQILVLAGCDKLERMSNISKVKSTDLRELDAGWCRSELGNQLRLMMVGSCCANHNRLRVLKLPISIGSKRSVMNWTDEVGSDEINHDTNACSSSYSAAASSSIPALRLRDAVFSCDLINSDSCRILNEAMAHFVHLQRLDISVKLDAEYPCWLDVSGLPRNLKELTLQGGFESEYPCWLEVSGLPNVQRLELQDFTSVKKLVISSSLVNLRFLNVMGFWALEEISGLGAHHAQLAALWIQWCPLMENFFDDDAQLPGLQDLLLSECSKLRGIPNLASITPSLEDLRLLQWTSLTDVSAVADLTNLRSLELSCCTALRRIPNLRHLGSLKSLTIDYPSFYWELRKAEDLHEMVSGEVEIKLCGNRLP